MKYPMLILFSVFTMNSAFANVFDSLCEGAPMSATRALEILKENSFANLTTQPVPIETRSRQILDGVHGEWYYRTESLSAKASLFNNSGRLELQIGFDRLNDYYQCGRDEHGMVCQIGGRPPFSSPDAVVLTDNCLSVTFSSKSAGRESQSVIKLTF
jgi:hypothetical protein